LTQIDTFQSWDTASQKRTRNDHCVRTIWRIAEGDYCLLDVIRAKDEFPELKAKAIKALAGVAPRAPRESVSGEISR
jgi:phage terminase large subunit-like protein